jgi:hypothetical protein
MYLIHNFHTEMFSSNCYSTPSTPPPPTILHTPTSVPTSIPHLLHITYTLLRTSSTTVSPCSTFNNPWRINTLRYTHHYATTLKLTKSPHRPSLRTDKTILTPQILIITYFLPTFILLYNFNWNHNNL